MDVSIIIINYNTKQLTLNCIESIYQSETNYRYEIILIDNHSSDGLVREIQLQFPDVHLISNNENVGFAKANNQGIRKAQGRMILLLNSDTEIRSDTIQIMLDYMDKHPDIGASGCKVLLPDGSLDKACKRGFPTPAAAFYHLTGLARLFPNVAQFNQYHLGYLDDDEIHEVDSLVGAFMLVRREVIEQVGLLDEEFFMYGEDIDWCYRIKQANWKVLYYPKTKILHYKGASSRRKPFKIIYEFHRAMFLFHRKHYAREYSWIVNLIVYVGISVKFTAACINNGIKRVLPK